MENESSSGRWSTKMNVYNSSLNASSSETHNPFALDKSLWFNLSLVVMMVLGSVGNGLCCYAVARYKFLRTVPNFYITALNVSDLITCVFVIPMMAYNGFQGNGWVSGRHSCVLWIFLFSTAAIASLLILCVISVDRYLSITATIKYLKYRKPRIALAVIFGTWLVVLVVSVWVVITRGVYHQDGCYPGGSTEVYRLVVSLCTFCVPTVILVVVNVGTARATWKINRPRRIGPAIPSKAPGETPAPKQRDVPVDLFKIQQIRSEKPSSSTRRSTYPTEADEALMADIPGPSLSKEPQRHSSSTAVVPITALVNPQRHDVDPCPNRQLTIEDIVAGRRKKSFAVIAVVVGSYIVCWLPFFCTMPFATQLSVANRTQVVPWPLVVSRWFCFLSSTINPIIYSSMKRDYKRAMKMMLP